MIKTRGVLAIIAALLMSVAFVVARTERRLLGMWLMTAGFAVASLWSLLSVFWAQDHPSPLSPKLWLTVVSMAVAATIYYGYHGLHGEGLGE